MTLTTDVLGPAATVAPGQNRAVQPAVGGLQDDWRWRGWVVAEAEEGLERLIPVLLPVMIEVELLLLLLLLLLQQQAWYLS